MTVPTSERIECARSAHADSSIYIYIIYIYTHLGKRGRGEGRPLFSG